ncbi:MAG TPA: PEP-CTERM sorting domain-containing protein [Phycisphaerae bacterium]|nr:PEP-CTERM sorting domain-containing protein [Phycisphaerae bacterium]
MNIKNVAVIAATLAMTSTAAFADLWPQNVNGAMNMKHVGVSLDGSNVVVHADLASSPLDLVNFGESYTAPADVLDGKAYNDQYGWIYEGFDVPGTGDAIWIELESQTAGLETYEGGMRMMKASHTYAPLFGTDGSSDIWRFDRMMTHNWYAAALPGDYSATYRVYVGDETTGVENLAYTSANVTLTWTNVPEPTSAFLLAGGAIVVLRRRRGTARTAR